MTQTTKTCQALVVGVVYTYVKLYSSLLEIF